MTALKKSLVSWSSGADTGENEAQDLLVQVHEFSLVSVHVRIGERGVNGDPGSWNESILDS